MNLADSLNSSYKKRNTLHDDNLNNNNTSECVNVVKHTKEEDSLGSGNQRHVHHDGPYHHRQRVNKVNNGWPQRSNNSCSRPNMPPMNPFLNQLWKGRVDIENFDRCHRTVPQHYQRHQHQYYRNDQSSSSYSSLSSSSSLLSSWNQNMNSYHGRCNSQTNYGQKIPSTAMEGYDNTRIMQYSTSTLSNNNETSEKYGTNSIIIHNNMKRTTRINSHNKNINNNNYNRDNHRRQYSNTGEHYVGDSAPGGTDMQPNEDDTNKEGAPTRKGPPPDPDGEVFGHAVPDIDEYTKEPPPLPPHLRHIILNKPPQLQDTAALPVPQHVALNHLYCTAIKDNMMVLGITQRFRTKFVTTVYYSPCAS